MLNNIKKKVSDTKENHRLRKIERERIAKEEMVKKETAAAEKLRKESQAILEERERLIDLDNKELMVEAVLAIRGFYSRYLEIQDELEFVQNRITEIERDIESLRDEIRYSSSSCEDNE